MIEIETPLPYPVAELGKGGVRLHLVHYKTVMEAQNKWNVRKTRINYDNVCLIMNDRNEFTIQDAYEFDKLPYKKILLTHLPIDGCGSAQYIKGFEKDPYVPVMAYYKNKFSIKKI
ncbi:protein of unknown function [Butyrivibrio proteoclasticus]|uniref:Uncharacterized protein n=2 Tax=Butyrivibrio proteoclasticus TaxID=43305 RepID=A0A1I5X7R7_9FIRM|nr:protein of unknown function [Butyrivibrio proteoclasticus]